MEKKEFKQRKQVHLKGFNYSSNEYVFFITICTAENKPYFSNPDICKVILNELDYRHTQKEIKIFCYCIMPDHLHMLISLEKNYKEKIGAFGERTLQNWVSAFKRYTSREGRRMYNIHAFWQKNFYDHIVRSDESLLEICQYILNNPVRKEIVSNWEEYPYSKIIDPLLL
jgi:REP element-mobilizing transposase RayT